MGWLPRGPLPAEVSQLISSGLAFVVAQEEVSESSSSTDVIPRIYLPDSSSIAQSTLVSSVSTVSQSIMVSESPQVLVHSSVITDGATIVSDSTASTSSDLGSAIDKIIESTIGPDIIQSECVLPAARAGGRSVTCPCVRAGWGDGAGRVERAAAVPDLGKTHLGGEGKHACVYTSFGEGALPRLSSWQVSELLPAGWQHCLWLTSLRRSHSCLNSGAIPALSALQSPQPAAAVLSSPFPPQAA